MQRFLCDCGNRLFFENTHCLACGHEVSWCPTCAALTALAETGSELHCARCKAKLWKCANRIDYDVCNRSIVPPTDSTPVGSLLCDCCRYNDTIPDLSIPGNSGHWLALEQAKRRLIYGLDSLGLPHGARVDGFDPGLSFEFKGDSVTTDGLWRSVGTMEKVYTGHVGGKITINIKEADTVEREKLRVDFGEGHRTLIGHFRHEIGHYYWDLLIGGDDEATARFKTLFGDHENPPYGEAPERYYADGPAENWQSGYISAYATMHPWEDWAESFAYYLNVVDVLETASVSGLIRVAMTNEVRAMVDTYIKLGILLNELNRAKGLIDYLPEVVVSDVVTKLQFVHDVIAGAARDGVPEAAT